MIYAILLILLCAFAIWSMIRGTWTGTWAGSGREESGRVYPGGPIREPQGRRY